MKKLVAILLLCCLLVVTSGYHLFYHYHLAQAKKEMKRSLLQSPNERVTVLSFPEREMVLLEWEDGREFRYHGEMYDVVSIEKKGTLYFIRCVADEKETALLERYFKMQHHANQHSPEKSLQKLITADYLPAANTILVPPEKGHQQPPKPFFSRLPIIAQAIPTPPPQAC